MAVEQPGLWRVVEDVLKGRNTNLLAVAQVSTNRHWRNQAAGSRLSHCLQCWTQVQKASPGVAKLSKQKKRLVAVSCSPGV